MSSLLQLLDTGLSSPTAATEAMDTVSNNTANAPAPGYKVEWANQTELLGREGDAGSGANGVGVTAATANPGTDYAAVQGVINLRKLTTERPSNTQYRIAFSAAAGMLNYTVTNGIANPGSARFPAEPQGLQSQDSATSANCQIRLSDLPSAELPQVIAKHREGASALQAAELAFAKLQNPSLFSVIQ